METLLCLLCIFLFVSVGPAGRWVHAGVPKGQGFTQSSILRHAVPLLWLNYCLGPNYGMLWLPVCHCCSVLPFEAWLRQFGSDGNQLLVQVFVSLFVLLKSSLTHFTSKIRSALLYINTFESLTIVWFHLIPQGLRVVLDGCGLSVWAALTKLSSCEKH